MKIKRLIALTTMTAALTCGAAFAQNNQYDGYLHQPPTLQDAQQPTLGHPDKNKHDEQLRKEREKQEKERIEKEKKARKKAEAKKKKNIKKPMPNPNNRYQQNWPRF